MQLISIRHVKSDNLERSGTNQFPVFLVLILYSTLIAGCTYTPPEPDFGLPYSVVIDDIAGAPESPPRLSGDWLFMNVAYPGGCTDHFFSLVRDVRSDTAHIWLKHAIPGTETCTDTIKDDLSVEMPLGVHSHHTIALHIPPGGPPYMLKWR